MKTRKEKSLRVFLFVLTLIVASINTFSRFPLLTKELNMRTNPKNQLFLLSVLICIFASCTKNNTVEVTNYKEITPQPSIIDLPILYKIQNLEDMINKKIPKTVYNDNSFNNNGNDKLKLKIKKNGRINLNMKKDLLSYSIPLKVKLEKKIIGTKKLFGTNLFKRGNIVEFSLILFFDSRVDIDSDWKLLTQTRYRGLKWQDEPTATIFKINIAGLVESALNKKMDDLEKKIDSSIHDNLNIKKQISKVWNDIQKPILINKEGEKVWLQFSPYAIKSSSISTKSRNLYLQIQLESFAKTLIGSSPKYEVNDSIPNLVKSENRTHQFDLNIVCKLPFDAINALLKSEVKGKEIEVEGQMLKIKSAIIGGTSNELLFNIDIGGDVEGNITFTGKPVFSKETNTIQIDKFDFDIESEEWLLTAVDQVLHDEIKYQITQKLSIPLEEQLKSIPTLISNGIEKGKLKEKINLYVDSLQIDLKETVITNQDFQFLVNGKGKILLVLENL